MKDLEEKEFKNKGKLLSCAIEEFSSNSYREASLNKIIENAHMSKGSFYFHFKNKKELYLHIFEIVGKKKMEFFKKRFASKKEEIMQLDFFEILNEYAKVGIEFTMKYPEYNKIGYRFFNEKDSEIYDEVKNMFTGKTEAPIKPIVDLAIKRGEFRKDFDRDFILKLLNGLINNFERVFMFDDRNNNFKAVPRVFKKYIDFIKYGLSARKVKG